MARRDVPLGQRFGSAEQVALKQLVPEVGAHVTHRRRLNALGEESDSTRLKVVGNTSQVGERTMQHINLDDRRQLDQRMHSLVSDKVVESELVARTGHLATCGERFAITFDASNNSITTLSGRTAPSSVEQLAARKVDENDAAAPRCCGSRRQAARLR